MTDIIDTMAEAIYAASRNLPAYQPEMGDDYTHQCYRKLAEAALGAIHKDNSWYGAPGDSHECPVCDTSFIAAEHGPLDIKWARND